MIIFLGTEAANAATAKPATIHAVPACTYAMAGNVAAFSISSAGEGDFPYEIGPQAVKLHQDAVADTTLWLHVCPVWENSGVNLSLKIYEPDGTPVSFELADGRVVYEVHDADDGKVDGKIDFYISNEDGSSLKKGNWTYELISHSKTSSTRYRI